MSVYYWQRALAAIDKKRLGLMQREVPEENDPIWLDVEQLAWLEQFAHTSIRLEEEAEIF